MRDVQPQSVHSRKVFEIMRAYSLSKTPEKPLKSPFFVLTDPNRTSDPVELAARLPKHASLVYRHYGAANRFEIAAKLKTICHKKQLTFFISADDNLSKAVKPDGIHWPKWSLKSIRRSQHVQLARFHTFSAHTIRQIHQPHLGFMHACLLSAVYPSESPSAPSPMGVIRFRNARHMTNIALIGLGGISFANAKAIAPFAGISGVGLFGKI